MAKSRLDESLYNDVRILYFYIVCRIMLREKEREREREREREYLLEVDYTLRITVCICDNRHEKKFP